MNEKLDHETFILKGETISIKIGKDVACGKPECNLVLFPDDFISHIVAHNDEKCDEVFVGRFSSSKVRSFRLYR